MYNLTVAEAHTFFVGDKQWLVHNDCGVKYGQKQLQLAFSNHASDFGVTGNWNKQNATAFEQALHNHITGPNTQAIPGTYRRTIPVTHYYDSTNNLNVMVDRGGNFVGGWRLSQDQITNLYRSGNIQ
jgi:hypothetical protein